MLSDLREVGQRKRGKTSGGVEMAKGEYETACEDGRYAASTASVCQKMNRVTGRQENWPTDGS